MTHSNRGHLVVDPNGKWQLCTSVIPSGSTVLGTVTREDGETGALVQFEKTGRYAQVICGAIRTLDGRKVAAALGASGRPAALLGGKRVNVYLDADSLARAAELGGGNVSEGIRIALALKAKDGA